MNQTKEEILKNIKKLENEYNISIYIEDNTFNPYISIQQIVVSDFSFRNNRDSYYTNSISLDDLNKLTNELNNYKKLLKEVNK